MAEPQIIPPPPAQIPVAHGPVMDVVAPPPEPGRPNPQPPAQPPAPAQKLPPKPPAKQGITAAIFATVIIVLCLAALAVYAYLKQNGR